MALPRRGNRMNVFKELQAKLSWEVTWIYLIFSFRNRHKLLI